ncbi:MAG: ABC transporter substrate-binding protein, partial [Clostridia bacterium]|nr:ABC transporter substrate-binding protein [Clostridia bacterium]
SPDGAPALAIACLSDKVSTSDTIYELNKKIVPASIVGDEAVKSDLAIVPANLAAKLYNGGSDI